MKGSGIIFFNRNKKYMKSKVLKIIMIIKKKTVQVYRKKYIEPDLKRKLSTIRGNDLTSTEVKAINSIWKGGGKYVDLRWNTFYKAIAKEGESISQYCPDSLFYSIIDFHLSDYKVATIFDDKNLYDTYFYDIPRPKTIIRNMDGIIMDGQYHKLSETEAVEKCKLYKEVICKPTIAMCGGKGIEFLSAMNSTADFLKVLKKPNTIIQEVMGQHQHIKNIYPHSLNTIRIMTLMKDDECIILSSVIRMGINGNKVDNVSSGGYACGIREDGSLREYAYNNKGESITVHPQGAIFSEFQIPNFDEFKETATKLAYRLCRISRLISWDFSVSEEGHPVFIEANLSWGELDFHQMCNGPIFGERTHEIWEWFKNKYLK